MCFIIDDNHKDPYITEKNLLVYKNVYELSGYAVYSQIMNYVYIERTKEPRIILKVVAPPPFYGDKIIDRGYHSYFLANYKNISGTIKYFTIPKGSKFYINETSKEIVSDNIIYTPEPRETEFMHHYLKRKNIIKNDKKRSFR